MYNTENIQEKVYTTEIIIQFGGKYSNFNSHPSIEVAKIRLNELKNQGASYLDFYVSSQINPCLVHPQMGGEGCMTNWVRTLKSGLYPANSAQLVEMRMEDPCSKLSIFGSWDELLSFCE